MPPYCFEPTETDRPRRDYQKGKRNKNCRDCGPCISRFTPITPIYSSFTPIHSLPLFFSFPQPDSLFYKTRIRLAQVT